MRKIKLGLIGLGLRGLSIYDTVIAPREEVEVVGVCDRYEDRVQTARDHVVQHQATQPLAATNYRDILALEGIDCVFIATDWNQHLNVAKAALQAKIAVACEVGGAYSLEELWSLVDTQEETGTPFMFMENCCFGRDELMVRNMVEKGVLGEIVYCSGGYLHDLRDEVTGGQENRHYRLENYRRRNADNYPTHELGPIAKILNINRGNRMLTVSSQSSRPGTGLEYYVKHKLPQAHHLQGQHFSQADIVVTNITCADGSLITLKLDTTLPRYYSRGFYVQGTKGLYNEENQSIFLDDEPSHQKAHFSWQDHWGNVESYRAQYEHPIWQKYLAEGIKGGHDGMDWLEFSAFFQALENAEPMPIDVYDAATWMSVTLLSENSLAQGGLPQSVPDFTRGLWINRR